MNLYDGIYPYLNKNAIINGDFDIWQRGTSFAAIAANQYHADRFTYNSGGAMEFTISRSTDVPTIAQSGHLSNYSLKVDCTAADTSIAAGDHCRIIHKIEGYNFRRVAQKAFTFSFWVKATKTGTYCVNFHNSGWDKTYVAEYTISSANTWEKKIITVTASPSAGTWDYVNGIGLSIEWVLACGSTYQTTANAWNAGVVIATANQINATDDVANNFFLSQIQLEPGWKATSFEARDIGTESALCRRYFRRYGGAGTYLYFSFGKCYSSERGYGFINFEPMRDTPVPTVSDATKLFLTDAASTPKAITATNYIVGQNNSSVYWIFNTSGMVAGNATLLGNVDATGYIDIGAEL